MFFQYFSAKEYEQGYLDIICFFNCFHDFGDLLRAIEQAQTKLPPQVSLLIVETFSSGRVADKFNPIG